MDVFHVFKIVQMVPNCAKRFISHRFFKGRSSKSFCYSLNVNYFEYFVKSYCKLQEPCPSGKGTEIPIQVARWLTQADKNKKLLPRLV